MRKYKIRKSLCMLLVLTLLAVSLAGCGRSEAKYTADGKKQIITIGYLPITHALAGLKKKNYSMQTKTALCRYSFRNSVPGPI